MSAYNEASRTLRWEYGDDKKEVLRLLGEHAGTLRELHVE
jgi:hypothetical protein